MQTRTVSLVEVLIDTAIGFGGSMIIYVFLAPAMLGITMTWEQNAGATAVFTVWSISRRFGTRRLFNWLERNVFRARPSL